MSSEIVNSGDIIFCFNADHSGDDSVKCGKSKISLQGFLPLPQCLRRQLTKISDDLFIFHRLSKPRADHVPFERHGTLLATWDLSAWRTWQNGEKEDVVWERDEAMLPQLVENAVLADACRVRVHSCSLKIGNSSACNKGENSKTHCKCKKVPQRN